VSTLAKRYGWGIHNNAEGKVALIAVESGDYKRLMKDPRTTKGKRFAPNATRRATSASGYQARVEIIRSARDAASRFVSTPESISRQSSRKRPSKKTPIPVSISANGADSANEIGLERTPNAEPAQDDEDPRQVVTDLVVDPRSVCGHCPEVGGVVVRGAVGIGLREVPPDPTNAERDECQETADPGGAQWHENQSRIAAFVGAATPAGELLARGALIGVLISHRAAGAYPRPWRPHLISGSSRFVISSPSLSVAQ
jgi:hypothetical protein